MPAAEAPKKIITKKTLKDILKVTAMNFVQLAVSILTGFIVPKILEVEDYGLFQTQALYAMYVGIIFLGFMDGIILRYSGRNYDDLNKPRIGLYYRLGFYWNTFVAAVLAVVSLTLLQGNVRWIAFLLALTIFLENANTHLGSLATMTQRFSLSTRIGMTASGVKFVAIMTLAILYYTKAVSTIPFYLYVLVAFVPTVVSLVCYVVAFRDLLFARGAKISDEKKNIWELVKTGLPLLISNFLILLILECDRQFVQLTFSTTIYAVYAFAYSMLRLLSVFVTSISSVLFPTLKSNDPKTVEDNYRKLIGMLLVVLGILSLAYYPVCLIVRWWLPKYVDSLPIFRVVIAAFCSYSLVAVIVQNVYKARMKNALFMLMSAFILALGIGLNFAAYFLFGTTYSISFATLITVFVWLLITSIPLSVQFKANDWKNYVFLVGFIGAYVGTYFLPWLWLDFIVMVVALALLIVVLLRGEVADVVRSVLRKLKKAPAKTGESSCKEATGDAAPGPEAHAQDEAVLLERQSDE